MGVLRVAIIEDSKTISQRLTALVREIDNTEVVGEASTEHDAIALCTAKLPDMIILDMQLAAGNGLGVMKAMQFNRNIDKPIIIVLTNFPSPIVQRNAIALGADYFLDKSFEFNKLLGLIYSIAEAKKATSASTEL